MLVEMHIVIVGAGLVGTQLARHLIHEKHDVSLIESNEERARYASNRLDCLVLHDEGNSLNALEEAGINRADGLVCVTDSDEVNMIICGLAASRYPALLKIARVRNDDYVRLNRTNKGYFKNPKILGIDYFVHPDVEASRSVLSAIEHGAIGNILAFADTPYELGSIDIAPESALDGLILKDFHTLVNGEGLITLVERKGESLLPTGTTTLLRGDRIHILTKENEMDRLFKLAGRSEKPLRKIGIVGGSRVGVLVAEGLLSREPDQEEDRRGKIGSFFARFKPLVFRNNRRVIIIEQDYSLCKELAARFPEALILNEDISDESFITEERIDDLDLIITATADQELNMIAAIYLKSRGVHRAVAMVTSAGYEAIARRLGVDVVVPMKSVVVDSILSHLMGGRIKGIHRLGDGSIGIIEIEIGPDSPVLDTRLADFHLSSEALVMLVSREGGAFIPRGDYIFTNGDKIVLIAKNGNETEIERFFGVSR
jgi:trk system potassium uptake protein TrkA